MSKDKLSNKTIDLKEYKVYSAYHWTRLLWRINPISPLFELVFGMRIPEVNLIKKSKLPSIHNVYTPCPHCNKIHKSSTWSTHYKTFSGNYFGLYCYQCGKVIPCIFSVYSFVIVMLFYPFWINFYNRLKNAWLKKQAPRFEIFLLSQEHENMKPQKKYISGLKFGVLMFLFSQILIPLLFKLELSLWKLLFSGVCWGLAGLWVDKYFWRPEGKNEESSGDGIKLK